MATISYEMPPSTFAALHLAPKEFAREMRIAASVQWYAQGLVSQERAAELAGLSRAEFLETLRSKKNSILDPSPDAPGAPDSPGSLGELVSSLPPDISQ